MTDLVVLVALLFVLVVFNVVTGLFVCICLDQLLLEGVLLLDRLKEVAAEFITASWNFYVYTFPELQNLFSRRMGTVGLVDSFLKSFLNQGEVG